MNERIIHPYDLDSNIAIGLNLPLNSTKNNFFDLTYYTSDQIKANLTNFLLTNPGERLMMPDYGCGYSAFLFENINDVDTIIDSTKAKVKQWLPYVIINDLTIDDSTDNQILIKLQYSTTIDPDVKYLTLEINK